jgi:hypothetical protein
MENDAWDALRTFQAGSVATTGKRDCVTEEKMVKEFLIQIPMPRIFECLQEASEKGSTKMVTIWSPSDMIRSMAAF